MRTFSKNKKLYIGGIVVLLLVCGGTAFAVHKHTDNVEAASEQTTKANSKLATINKKYGNFNKLENDDVKLQTLKELKAEYDKYSKKDSVNSKVISKYKAYIAEETKYFKTVNAKTLKDNMLVEDKIKDTDVGQLQEKTNGLNGYIDTVNKEAKIVYTTEQAKKLVASAHNLKAKYDVKVTEEAASSSSAVAQQATSTYNSSKASGSSQNTGTNGYSSNDGSSNGSITSNNQSSTSNNQSSGNVITYWSSDENGNTAYSTIQNNGNNTTINGGDGFTVN